MRRGSKKEEYNASLFLLALLVIITDNQPDVWFALDEERDMASLFVFAHKCIMATTACWNTLPGAIETYKTPSFIVPSKQAEFVTLSTLSFVGSLQHWKLKWLPKGHKYSITVQSPQPSNVERRQKDNSNAGNSSSIEPASTSQARGRSLSAGGGNPGRQQGGRGTMCSKPKKGGSKQAKLPAQNAELLEDDSVYTSPGDDLDLRTTEVRHNL